jgi:hypothetical protein
LGVRIFKGWLLGGVISAVLLGPGLAQAAAILRAHIQFVGKVPRMGLLKRTESACGGNKFATDEDVVVGATGGLKNVLIYVSKGAAPGARARDAELTTQACMIRPRVTAVTHGAQLHLANGDAVGHLWHAFHGVKTELLEMQAPAGGPTMSREIKQPPGELLRIRDDQRPWMMGYVMVVDNPYFGVSNDLGDVIVQDMPPGTYTITAWHERYGAKTAELVVGAEGYADVKFAFDGTEPRP